MQRVDCYFDSFFFLAKWTKLQLSFDCLCFKCTVLLLPAHLPEKIPHCVETRSALAPLTPFISTRYYPQYLQEVIKSPGKDKDKRPTCLSWRGLEVWVNWGRTFPPADEVWYKDMLLINKKSVLFRKERCGPDTRRKGGEGDLALWGSASDTTAIKTWIIRGHICIKVCFFFCFLPLCNREINAEFSRIEMLRDYWNTHVFEHPIYILKKRWFYPLQKYNGILRLQ